MYTFSADRDDIHSHVHVSTEPVFTMTQYHAVRALSTPGFMGKPLVDHFHHLFPAVDILRLGRLHKSVREDAYPDIRAANQRAQECSRVWKKLDLVVCDARMLYVLSLRCPIRLVMLDYGKEDGQRYAAEALRENPVPHLKITLGHGRHMFGGLFSPELGGKLTHLTLCMLYYNHIRAHSGPDGTAGPQLRWSDVLVRVLACMMQPARAHRPWILFSALHRTRWSLRSARYTGSPTSASSCTPMSMFTTTHFPLSCPPKSMPSPFAGRRSTSKEPLPRSSLSSHHCSICSSRPAGCSTHGRTTAIRAQGGGRRMNSGTSPEPGGFKARRPALWTSLKTERGSLRRWTTRFRLPLFVRRTLFSRNRTR